MEEWRQIEGWPGYEVSSIGRVRSYWGPAPWRLKGNITGTGRGKRVITETPKNIGYKQQSGHRGVQLARNGEKQRFGIHVLVLEAFVGPRPDGMFACHNNGDPADNRIGNLRWATPRENIMDAVQHGTLGSLTKSQVIEIWNAIVAGEPLAKIARRMGVSAAIINHIRAGNSWSHITGTLPGKPELPSRAHAPVYPDPVLAASTEEIWRYLPGWRGYRVSNFGRVQTCIEKDAGGKRFAMRLGDNWRDMALPTDKDGYLIFGTYDRGLGGNRAKTWKVHRAVLIAFVGEPLPGHIGCHGDGNRKNNHLSNLRWDTWQANARDRRLLLLQRKRTISIKSGQPASVYAVN